jgi:cytochrome c-type biogenesis protein
MDPDFIKNNSKILAVILVAIIIGVGVYSFFEGKQTSDAPDFTVTDTKGNDFTLSSYEGNKVVVLDFMSTSCPSCEKEMPELVKLHNKYGNTIVMLSISTLPSDSNDDIDEFMDEYNAKWRAARDEGGELIDLYNIKEIVRVIIVDKEGKITFSHTGASGFEDLDKEVKAAMDGTAESVEISSGVGLAALAIGAGIFAFFSPCAFPMLPGYMSFYLAKGSQTSSTEGGAEGTDVQWEFEDEDRKRREKSESIRKGAKSGIATALGIVSFYLFIGLLVSISGELVKDYIDVLEPLIGFMLIMLGILMVQNIPIGQHVKNAWITLKWKLFDSSQEPEVDEYGYAIEKEPGFQDKLTVSVENLISRITKKEFTFAQASEEGYFGLYSFGIGYGAASAGCCFPLFLAIILAALDQGGAAKGFYIFVLYAFSMGILMVVVTIFVSMSRNTLLNKMRSATGKIELIGGFSLQIVGIYLIWYALS